MKMPAGFFRNIFSIAFGDLAEAPYPLVEHQLHFVQSCLTPDIANNVFNDICIPEHIFLDSISQNSPEPEVTQTQVRRIWWFIKA
jgi:hypothetical protein